MRIQGVSKLLPVLAGAFFVLAATQADAAPKKKKQAQPQPAAEQTVSGRGTTDLSTDPWEPFNRSMFEFNSVVDAILLRPVAVGYRYITPQVVRTHIGNVADNLSEPLNMVNSFLQGEFTNGMQDFWRFLINSTLGIGGLNDVATVAGIPEHDEDFGQTLAVWGVDSGPYLVLPIFGPSDVRDAFGRVGDWGLDPVNYFVDTDVSIGIAVGQGIVQRERLIDPIDDIENSSLDPYVSFRSIYEQRRRAQIANSPEGDKQPNLSLPE